MSAINSKWTATAAVVLAMASGQAFAQDCPKLGGVVALTGAQGAIGKVIADAGRLAVDQANKAGGVKGCQVEFVVRDDTSQPSVGLDAARFLVDVQKVNAIVGLVGSGTALSVVNSVSVPNKVPTIACCAVTPALTKMAEEGKTGGYFFRTIPTARNMALAHAKAVTDRGYKKTVIMYINNDFGNGVAPDAKRRDQGAGAGTRFAGAGGPVGRRHRAAARVVLAGRHPQRGAAQHHALGRGHQERG